MQRWARACRDNIYHAAVERNNGAEVLNRMLKYLSPEKHMNLSYHLKNHKWISPRNVFKNFKQSELYRSNNPSIIPDYLQGHPNQTILHCFHCLQLQVTSLPLQMSFISVQAFPNLRAKGTHTRDFGLKSGEPSCSCKNWITHHMPCKHFFAVFNQHPQYQVATRFHHITHGQSSETCSIPERIDDNNGDSSDIQHTTLFLERHGKIWCICMSCFYCLCCS